MFIQVVFNLLPDLTHNRQNRLVISCRTRVARLVHWSDGCLLVQIPYSWYKSRSLCAFFQVFGAASIQVCLLFEGGLYAKS